MTSRSVSVSGGPQPHEGGWTNSLTGKVMEHGVFNIPLTTFSTFILLMSSVAMVLALNYTQRGDRKKSALWLFLTAFGGSIFLGCQVYEFTSFVHEGLTIRTNLFGSSFFTWVGGSNYTDGPRVRVERRVGKRWRLFADGTGEVARGGAGQGGEADGAEEVEARLAGLLESVEDVVEIVDAERLQDEEHQRADRAAVAANKLGERRVGPLGRQNDRLGSFF